MPEQPEDLRHTQLTAYLDGELDARSAEEITQQLREDPALRREAEVLKRTWELLDFLPQPEPSAQFTSRTLDKLEVVRPSLTSAPTRPATMQVATAAPAVPARNPWPRRLLLAAAALVLFLVGYGLPGPFLRKGPPRLTPQQMDEQMARDLRIVDQLPLYQAGDDIDFLVGLDHPDLFGEP